MSVPEPGSTVTITTLSKDNAYQARPIKKVCLLGYAGKLKWKQTESGLEIQCPEQMPYSTSVVFRVD